MELPEGWKRCVEEINESWSPERTTDEEQLIFAFNLMKEMAEALAYLERFHIICPNPMGVASLFKNVFALPEPDLHIFLKLLKKFKEWK